MYDNHDISRRVEGLNVCREDVFWRERRDQKEGCGRNVYVQINEWVAVDVERRARRTASRSRKFLLRPALALFQAPRSHPVRI